MTEKPFGAVANRSAQWWDQELGNICVRINAELCKACSYCSYVCPKGIIELSVETNSKGYHYALVRDLEKCTGCRFCAFICPEVAIEIELVNRATAQLEC